MNILYICGYSAEYGGNFISSIMSLNKTACQNGHCCFIFPPEAKDRDWVNELEQTGAHVFYNTGSVIGKWSLQRRLCIKYDIDVIYHHFWNLKDCLVSKLLKYSTKRIKFVIHYHNEYHINDSRLKEEIKHWILDADMSIGCGKHVAEELREAGYRNVRWIDNCIDFNRLDHWSRFEVPEGINCLTFSSCGYSIKGVDTSIRAVYAARERDIPVNLLIVIAAHYAEIERSVLAECKGSIPEWIKLLPARTDVATYYHAADAYLNSSRSEGLCYSAIEAIYCGAQVIQTNIPGNPLDIPGTLIFAVNDIEQCANCICELYDSVVKPALSVKAAQKKYVLEKYSLPTWVREVSEALGSLK